MTDTDAEQKREGAQQRGVCARVRLWRWAVRVEYIIAHVEWYMYISAHPAPLRPLKHPLDEPVTADVML